MCVFIQIWTLFNLWDLYFKWLYLLFAHMIHVRGWSQQQLFWGVPEQKVPVRWCYSLNYHNMRSTSVYLHPLLLCVVIPSWRKNTLTGSLSIPFFMIPFLLSFFTLTFFRLFNPSQRISHDCSCKTRMTSWILNLSSGRQWLLCRLLLPRVLPLRSGWRTLFVMVFETVYSLKGRIMDENWTSPLVFQINLVSSSFQLIYEKMRITHQGKGSKGQAKASAVKCNLWIYQIYTYNRPP